MNNFLSLMPLWGWMLVAAIFFLILFSFTRRKEKKDFQQEDMSLDALESACDASEELVLIVHRDYQVLYSNRAANMLYSFKESESLKNALDAYRFYEEEKEEWKGLDQLIYSHRRRKVDEPTVFQNLRLGQNLLGPVHVTIRSIARGTAEHRDVVVIHNDSCEYRLLTQKFLNGLSGLPNRYKANKDITALISQYSEERRFALIVFELEDITELRSLLGYEEIEKIITNITNVLREISYDARFHCYHLSFVNFLLVMEDPNSNDEIYATIQTFKNLFKQNYSKAQGQQDLTFCYGVASFPQYRNFTDLLNASYKALARAKEQGPGRVVFAEEGMTEQMDHTLLINHEIEQGLAHRDFRLYFQPLFSAKDLSLVGAEVLIRWQDPERGFRMPNTFIPIAEKSGLIIEIGKYVLEETLKRLSHWHQAGFPPIMLNINLSLRELEEPDFINRLTQLLQKYDIGKSRIKFEITEHAAMTNPLLVLEQLKKIRELGIGIALDDFGTGYSSFSYLAELPIDTLKIDKSFISGVLQDESKRQIVSTIAKLGHSLGMNLVAEGIEDEKEAELLKKYDLDIFQGYYFSKPLPQLEFQYLLTHPETGAKG